MPTITDAVAFIRAADLPVLLVDTCSLVDPIRAPLRPDELRGCIQAAQELLVLATGPPPRCTIVIASFVHGEWLTHAGPESDRLRAALVQVDTDAERFHDCCDLHVQHQGLLRIGAVASRPGH